MKTVYRIGLPCPVNGQVFATPFRLKEKNQQFSVQGIAVGCSQCKGIHTIDLNTSRDKYFTIEEQILD